MLHESKISSNHYLIKQLPQATAFIDRKLRVVYASDQWIDAFDFTYDDVIGKNLRHLFHEISADWKKVLDDCLLGMPSQSGMERYLDDEKNEKWFKWTNSPWYDDDENIIGVIIHTQDVTNEVLTDLKLDKLEFLLNEKSEIAKIGSWEYDAVKDELSWCTMTKTIHEVPMDYKPDLEHGINFYKEGYSRNTLAMSIDRAMSKGIPWSEKLQLVTAKGKEIWVIAAGRPVYKDNKFLGLIGTLQDINDTIISELKTKESEQLLRTLIDHLPLNVFIKDLESKKVLANKSEIEFCGLKNESQIIGKDDFEFFDETTARNSREEDLSVMHSFVPILGKETLNLKKDGTATTFLTSKIPLKDDDGEITGLVGISLDISDLKQKEEDLRSLINVTSSQNKKLINFAHIVSHNLRSHTANFSMLLEFLINEKEENEKKKIVDMLVDASDNLLDTLDNLNEVIAINTNTNHEKKRVRLNDKISTTENNLSAYLKNHNAKIFNHISDDTYINAIPEYIDSILMNFITNAVRYRDPRRDPRIKLSSNSANGYTILSIEDNGLGIDLKKHGDKLFGMYKTFHNHPDARGIGLFITKNQVESMNGKIITCSEVGKGTIFNIYFNERN